MRPERWQLISRIFKSAISLDGEARRKYVAGECGADESLRAEVEQLIDSHQRASAEEFIAGVAAEENAKLLVDHQELGEQPSQRLTKGQQLGAYEVLGVLGEGGMGEVYLAKDSRLDRTVALKVLSEEISADRRRMQRFRQEARIASSLNQPNILTIYEFGDVGSLTFLATEFVDGETLRHHVRTVKLKLPEILDISIQMLAALDVAHEAGIVHRDIKPENVMIRRRDNVVKVLDFGLAKLTEKGAASTSAGTGSGDDVPTEVKTIPGTLMGTVNYMSPEQTQAHKVDERTDIWSTGAIIYEMVTGTTPFKGTTTSHTIVQILEKNLAPLSQLAKEPVPPELERIVAKALSKNPDERYQTAKDMLIDLRSLRKRIDVETEIGRSSSPTMMRPAFTSDRAKQRKRVLIIALIAMTLVTAVFAGISFWRASRARNAAIATPPSPVPVAERTLTYWITVQKFRDGRPFQAPFVLASEINFELDYHIRINVRSPQAGHLYVLNEGPSGEPEYVILFPSATANNGSAFLQSEQLVQIPEESWIRFDAEQGVEKVWFVFAAEAIPELEALKRFANKTDRGLITDATQRTAVREFLSKHAASQSEKQETQTVVKASGNVLVYSIKLEHH